MNNAELHVDDILAEYWKMTPEELDQRISRTLSMPFGKMLKKINDETIAVIQQIDQKSNGNYIDTELVYSLETITSSYGNDIRKLFTQDSMSPMMSETLVERHSLQKSETNIFIDDMEYSWAA